MKVGRYVLGIRQFALRFFFRSPGRSQGRAIVLPPASVLAAAASASAFYVKVFYVMGKVLSGKLSCPCDRSCLYFF